MSDEEERDRGKLPCCASLLIQSLLDKKDYFHKQLSAWKEWNSYVWQYEQYELTSDDLIMKCAEIFDWLLPLQLFDRRFFVLIGYFNETTVMEDFLEIEIKILRQGWYGTGNRTVEIDTRLRETYRKILQKIKVNTVADLLKLTPQDCLDKEDWEDDQRFNVEDLCDIAKQFTEKNENISSEGFRLTYWLIYSQMKKEMDFNGDYPKVTLERLETFLASNTDRHRHHVKDAFTVGDSHATSPASSRSPSPPSRSPSISPRDTHRPGRGMTPLPTTEQWLHRYAHRLQQFGTTVIPFDVLKRHAPQLDAKKKFGAEVIVQTDDVVPTHQYKLVQLNDKNQTEYRIGDINFGSRYHQTNHIFDLDTRRDSHANCTDIKMRLIDVDVNNRPIKLSLEIKGWSLLRDETGLLQWQYMNGILTISQFFTETGKKNVLQKIKDEITTTQGRIASMKDPQSNFQTSMAKETDEEKKKRIRKSWEESIQKQETKKEALEALKLKIEPDDVTHIEICKITVSEKFTHGPTKFLLQQNLFGIKIMSCMYMQADIYQYLLQPDEALENPSPETTALYERLKDGENGTKFIPTITGKRDAGDNRKMVQLLIQLRQLSM